MAQYSVASVVTAKQLVIALIKDLTIHSDDDDCFEISSISYLIPGVITTGYLKRILSFLESQGLIECHTTTGRRSISCWVLTERGFLLAENLPDYSDFILGEGGSPVDQPDAFDSEADKVAETVRRAESEVIRLPVATKTYREIADRLMALKERVRGANDENISDESKKQIVAQLDNAISIWDEAEFTLLNYKIGVLLAVERAEILIHRVSKATATELLSNTIAEFVKNFIK